MKTKFSIYDGRASFCQWDVDQRIVILTDACNEVHIAHVGDALALRCEIYDLDGKSVIDVPDELLQVGKPLCVFAYILDDKGGRTTHSEIFTVLTKPKPDNYVYTKTEIRTWESLAERISKLEDGNPGNVDIPSALPNPHKLTLTGAVNAEYDGSEEVKVEIPQGGEVWKEISSGELTEETTSISITLDNNGNEFALKKGMLFLKVVGTATNTVDRGQLQFKHNNPGSSGAPVTRSIMTRSGSHVAPMLVAQYDFTGDENLPIGRCFYKGDQDPSGANASIAPHTCLRSLYITGITENAKYMGVGTKWKLIGVRV